MKTCKDCIHYEVCKSFLRSMGITINTTSSSEDTCLHFSDASKYVEQKHGQWVKDGESLVCLNCETEIDVYNKLGVQNANDYCPRCGLRMAIMTRKSKTNQ